MLLKHFLLTTFFTLSSVTANPGPNANNHDVEARDVGDLDGNLAARNDGHDCGRDAFWNGKQYICRNRDMKYNPRTKRCSCPEGQTWNGRKCEYDCGRDAVFNDKFNKCICRNHELAYDPHTKKCNCPRGKKYDWRTEKCH